MKKVTTPMAVGTALVGVSIGMVTTVGLAEDMDSVEPNDSVLTKLGLGTAAAVGESAALSRAVVDDGVAMVDQEEWNDPVFYLADNRDASPEDLDTMIGSSGSFQSVNAEPPLIKNYPDEDAVVHAVYNADSPTTAGLALRVHFDSSKLVWVDLEDVLQTNLIETTPPLVDGGDYDGDPETDMYVALNWSTLAATWPGSIPIPLFDARFQVHDFVTEDTVTRVNFSAVYTADNRPLLQTPATIEISKCPIVLDVDCDQQVNALTDGVLTLRYQLGLGGDALIQGALGPDCDRCDAADIEIYLRSLSELNAP